MPFIILERTGAAAPMCCPGGGNKTCFLPQFCECLKFVEKLTPLRYLMSGVLHLYSKIFPSLWCIPPLAHNHGMLSIHPVNLGTCVRLISRKRGGQDKGCVTYVPKSFSTSSLEILYEPSSPEVSSFCISQHWWCPPVSSDTVLSMEEPARKWLR